MGITESVTDPMRERLRHVARPQAGVSPLAEAGVDLSLDRVYEILKNERRRRVLGHLDRAEGPVELGTLAEEIAAQENDTTVAGIDSSQRKRVYVALYQCHLPKMADMGVVEYDRRGGRVKLTAAAESILNVVREPTPKRRPWYKYYGSIGSGTTALFIANYLALLPVHIAANVFSVLVIAILVVLSTVHGVLSHREGAT